MNTSLLWSIAKGFREIADTLGITNRRKFMKVAVVAIIIPIIMFGILWVLMMYL